MRDLTRLPKAHLHLHFTGSLRLTSLVEMAEERGIRLPAAITDADPLRVPADQRGWFRFQRQYDAARAVVRGEAAIRRVV
ncbi:MAG: adenosine deaminase, partial [Actinomycetes bacterium]|nr:adenosine deaminase [Actinomycetes bacterium]